MDGVDTVDGLAADLDHVVGVEQEPGRFDRVDEQFVLHLLERRAGLLGEHTEIGRHPRRIGGKQIAECIGREVDHAGRGIEQQLHRTVTDGHRCVERQQRRQIGRHRHELGLVVDRSGHRDVTEVAGADGEVELDRAGVDGVLRGCGQRERLDRREGVAVGRPDGHERPDAQSNEGHHRERSTATTLDGLEWRLGRAPRIDDPRLTRRRRKRRTHELRLRRQRRGVTSRLRPVRSRS